MVFWLVSPTPDPRRPTPARQACCRVFRPKNAFLWRAVAFFREKTRSSGVLSRLFAEKRVFPACDRVFPASCHVFPACCRVYPAKNAFIRRAVAFIRRKTRSSGVLSRFSAKKRAHPACCHVFQPKNAFIRRAIAFFRRKTCLSSEKRVYPVKNVFFRRKTRLSALVQDNPAGLSCPRKETRWPPHTPLLPFAEVFRQTGSG